MTEDQTLQRAEQARQIVENPLFREAMEIIERDIIEMMVACPERDVEGLRFLQQHIRNARKLRNIFLGAIQDGKIILDRRKPPVMDKVFNFMRKK